jgi:hypothetical protein
VYQDKKLKKRPRPNRAIIITGYINYDMGNFVGFAVVKAVTIKSIVYSQTMGSVQTTCTVQG